MENKYNSVVNYDCNQFGNTKKNYIHDVSTGTKIKLTSKDCLLLIILIVTSIISIFYLFYDMNQPEMYSFMFIMPLAFMVLTITFWRFTVQQAYHNIGVAIIVIELYIRNVITPFIMSIGEYKSVFSINNPSNVTVAVVLMVYEVFACYLVLFFNYKPHVNSYENTDLAIVSKKVNTTLVTTVIVIISLFDIAFYILVPEVREVYRAFFELFMSGVKDNAYNYREVFSGAFFMRIATTLATFSFSIIRVIVPAQIIIRMSAKKKSNFRFFVSLLLISMQFFFVPTVVAVPFIVSFLLVLLLIRIYPEKQRFMIIIISVLSVCVVLTFSTIYSTLSNWYGLENIKQFISYWLNSYMTGIDNVAMTRSIADGDRITVLINTLVAALPFRSVLLPQTAGIVTINRLFTELPGCGGQIVSTIGGGAYMLGGVLAPAFSVVFTRISLKYGNKYLKSQNMWEQVAYLYLCIQAALGLGMYNIPITLSSIIEVGVPLLLINRLYGRK